MWHLRVLLGVLLLGVIAGPVGSQPASPSPAQAQGSGPAGFTRWEGTLGPDQALAIALEHSLEISLGKARADVIRAEALEAAAASRLKVSLGSYFSVGSTPMFWGVNPTGMSPFIARLPNPAALNLNLMAMYPLFTGGLLENRLLAAEEAEKAALARAALALRATSRDVRRAYYQVVQVRARQAEARWELEQRREMQRVAELQYKTGRVARYVVLRAQAEAAAAEQRLNEVLAQGVEAEAALKVTMGVAVTSEFTYPALAEPPAEELDEGSLQRALEERPDLVAARHALREGDWRLAAALADYSPQLYLVGMAEGMKQDPFLNTRWEGGYQVGLALSWPLYDGGERSAREEKAKASLRVAEQELRQLELAVTGEVMSARARLRSTRDNVILAERAVLEADENLRITQLRYEVGRALPVEVLDALAAATRARADRVNRAYELHAAYAQLLYTTGRY